MNCCIAGIEDCERLTELRMAMRLEREGAGVNTEEFFRNTLNFFKTSIRDGSHVAFAGVENGKMIATVGLTFFYLPPTLKLPNGKVGKLMNVYVVPEYRRQGIAAQMLDAVMAYAKEHDCYRIILNSSPMGASLYQKYGFVLIPNEYEFYINNEPE